MFEYEGKDWTVEDIQAAADRKGVSYDDALAKLTQAGMKQKEFTFKSLVEDVPAFQWILRGTETVVNLVDEGINLIETGKVPLGADPTGMSNALQRRIQSEAFLIDAARKGIDPETAKELDPTNRIKLDNAVKWFRETLPEQELDENGQPKDYLKYYSEGEIEKGTNALIGDLAAAIPSLVLSMTPGGAAILGFTSYGEEFDKELYERSKDPKFDIIKDRDKLVANALITGASDFVTERIGGGLINKTIGRGFTKNTVEEILTKAPQELMKRAGFGFLSEFATEGATGVIQELADSWTFGDAYKPVSNYLRTFVKDGFVGGFLGGTVSARPYSKKGIYNYVSPQTYKKEQYELEKQIVDLSRDKENATSQKDITFFDNQIKQLKDQKKLNEQRLFDKFDNMTKAEKKEYAQNIDKQNEMLDIIGNNKYSKETQESAQKQLNKFAEANNKFFKVGDLKYDAELEVLVGKTLKTTERIKEQKGSFGFNKKNLNVVYLNNQSDVDNLLQKDEELKKAGFTSADGVFHKDAKDGPTIYINVPVASLTNQSNVLGHEYLHAIVSQAFDNIGATNLKQSVVAFKDYLIQTGQQELVNDIEERIAKSYNGVDADGNIIRDENGLVKTKKTKDQEEYFNIFSDLIKSRKIQAVEEKSKGIKNSFRQLITGLGFKKVDFQNGKEVFDFLVDYNANMSRSGFAGKILSKRIAKTEFKGLEAIGQEVEQPGAKESRSYTKTPRDIRIDKLGEQYTKEQWDKRGAEEAIGELYMSGDLEAIVKNNLSSALRDLPGFSEEDFVSETIAELIPHIKNFNINRKEDQASFGLSGWIRGQVNNKIGNVLKAKKATREAFESDIEESTQAQVAVAEEQEVELFEEQDLSLVGQAKALKEKTERQSKLRRQLGFETGGEMYNKVLSSAKKSVLLAYRKTQSIKDPAQRAKAIKDLLRKEYFTSGLTSDLFKATKNFLGTKDYIKNLKEYREAIIEGLSTADLVQMERNVPDSERVFTVFDKKLTKIQEVEDAVNKGLLPTEAINTIGKGTAVNLYRKRMPTEQELVSFADQPAINPVTGQRSGLKGTRKDGFAKAIANSMVLDAVMEVRQSEGVVEALQDDAIAQLDLIALSDAVGREVNVKFSKSTATVDINSAIDNNINLAVYSQIKFSRSHREAYENRLTKKRTDLDEKQIKGAVESIFKFVEGDNIPNNKRAKFEKLAFHYMANGYLILPEDGYKVIEAERIATIKKIDPFSYKNPNELIEKFVGEVKGARTNPDTVKEFTNKTDVGQGVTVYDVEDSKKGQLAVRKVIDTHFGKKANPWCLAARDNRIDQEYAELDTRDEANRFADELKERGFKVEINPIQGTGTFEVYGDLMAEPGSATELDAAFKAWKRYNKEDNGFKIAFKNGKLLCFRDGNEKRWWDRNDKPSDKIHFTVTEKKGDVESIYSVVPEDGTKTLTKRTKGKMPNAEVFYVRDDNNYNIKSNTTYVNGAITKQTIETTYKDSRLAGAIYLEKEMGQNADFQLSNMTKDIQVLDGNILTTKLKGKVALTSKQFKQFEDKAVEIEHVTNAQTSETISLTVNGVKQDIGVKFSKSAAEDTYKSVEELTNLLNSKSDKILKTILIERRAIEDRINNENYEEGDQIVLRALLELESAIENDLAPLDVYNKMRDVISQKSSNINFESIEKFIKHIKKVSVREIRQEGFKSLRKHLEAELKGKSLTKQIEIIDEFIRNAGRTGRTAKVFGITTNEQLKEQVIDKLLGGDVADKYNLVDGNFRGKSFENVELYENIEYIKNNVRDSKSGIREKIDRQAKEARGYVFKILDSDLSLSEKYAIIDLLAIDQRGTIRKMYTMGVSVTLGSELYYKKLRLEHEITVSDMVSYLKAYAKNENKAAAKKVLEEILNQARVHVLPKGIDDVLNSEGLKSTGGRTRYQNEKVKDYLNNLAKRKIIDSLPVELTEVSNIAILGKAIKFSRSVNNPTKGITVLDFDDTLATSKSLVKFTRPDGSKGTLTPEQYAATYEDLSDLGYKFDFSEFSKVVDGKPAPLLNKAKKLAGKFGTENMFILTARPADSAPAIKAFLKANGLDIPLKNITGLGNSTAEAKALWMADKVADGYNDFYFADDALKNVQAVKNVLDQFDVKSKIQQARVKFSKSLSPELNKMIERNKGFAAERVFDEATAKQLGKDKGKYEFFISAGADDFQGLMMRLAGKGKQGDRDMQFFKETLFDPFNKAYREMNEYAYVMINDLDALIKEYPDVRKRFKQPLEGTDFDTDQAIRIYLWNKNGQDIPGLSDEQTANISSKVASDSRLVEFATKLNKIPKLKGEYVKPGENWTVENIKADIYNAVENSRAEFLLEWQENADQLFSEENLNKLEAVYGSDYVDALKNMLHRMKTGKNRPAGKDKDANKLLNWINNSVGAIMFFNSRSSVLQTLSIVNFLDYENNNIFAAGKAFVNQKQYWKDFSFLFNSPTLKMRRAGVQTDVSASDIAEAVRGKRNPAKAAIAYLLKIGFTPTQIADSFAISAGGATYYRNQVNFYIKEGMSRLKAEEKAFADFQSKTEEAQQSSRPDRISRQQASVLGRLILAFQNTPMQYNRIIKKAVVDIVNGRGDFKANASRILYYGTAQGLIFNALQNAIFALDFDDDEEKMNDEQLKKAQKFKEKKYNRIVDGMISSLLRGSGLTGAYVDSIYKTIKEWQTQREKGWKADHAETVITALNVSPPIGSKFRKLYSAIKSDKFNKDIYDKMSYGNIEHPIYDVASSAIEAVTNAPTQRVHRKIINIKDAFQENINAWQRVFLLGGWNKWGLGIEESGEKEEAREAAKKEKKEALKNRKPKKGEARCKAVTSSGKRCKNMTTNKSGLCYAHD